MKAYLILEDGSVFEGTSIGANKDTISEAVFNTSMTGCEGLLFDPSFTGQALVMTYPLAGHIYFSSDNTCEKIWPDGIILRNISDYKIDGKNTLNDFLKIHDIPGIADIDTRALAKLIRDKGTMNCLITTNKDFDLNTIIPVLKNHKITDAVNKTTCSDIYSVEGSGANISVLDLGVSKSVINALSKRNCNVTVYPAFSNVETILSNNPDGVVISDGPGNPVDCDSIIKEIQKLLQKNIPVFAVGLGHLLVLLAKGGNCYKLKYGHRGINQPVKFMETGRVYISVQNYGYSADMDSIEKANAKVSFVNVNDGTVEGVEYTDIPAFSVQFQPETSFGSVDTAFLYDRFIEMTGGRK